MKPYEPAAQLGVQTTARVQSSYEALSACSSARSSDDGSVCSSARSSDGSSACSSDTVLTAVQTAAQLRVQSSYEALSACSSARSSDGSSALCCVARASKCRSRPAATIEPDRVKGGGGGGPDTVPENRHCRTFRMWVRRVCKIRLHAWYGKIESAWGYTSQL
jgi:hypothetical protein